MSHFGATLPAGMLAAVSLWRNSMAGSVASWPGGRIRHLLPGPARTVSRGSAWEVDCCPPELGSPALCVDQAAVAEQVEAGAAVHLPLEQLEAGDLTLGLAAAPRRGGRGTDR